MSVFCILFIWHNIVLLELCTIYLFLLGFRMYFCMYKMCGKGCVRLIKGLSESLFLEACFLLLRRIISKSILTVSLTVKAWILVTLFIIYVMYVKVAVISTNDAAAKPYNNSLITHCSFYTLVKASWIYFPQTVLLMDSCERRYLDSSQICHWLRSLNLLVTLLIWG